MSRKALRLDRLRQGMDTALVGLSTTLAAWPWLFDDAIRGAGLHAGDGTGLAAWAWVLAAPVATVACITFAIVLSVGRWPLLQYLPMAVALGSIVVEQIRVGVLPPATTWLLVGGAAIGVTRHLLGARTNDELLRDLSQQRVQLARQAYRDPLTELGNRTHFLERAGDALDSAHDYTTAVVVFDLDGFRHVNDTWGHATGDALLRSAAERLQANVRNNDTVARLGGDEFAVLLPRLVDDQIADTVANRILHDLAQPLIIGETVLTIPASAGIGLVRGLGSGVEALLREADLALTQAKAEGRKVARRFDPQQFAAAEQRQRDEEELRTALEDEQFEVHYQPIVDLDGEHTVGVEALVRWKHPNRGLLAPVAFLDLAESIGILPRLGGWVLLQACRQAAQWQQQRPNFEVNVNLSASQLSNPDLVEEVRQVLQNTGLPPALLVLELTESVALTDLVESARILRNLKQLGIRIALDDFGTGFSSLSHLGTLPVDVVKIDRSFVQAMAENSGATVAEAVLQIARTFNLSPVAEGVEDAEQASRLRDLDCAQAQGYHFARPMPAVELTALLSRQEQNAENLSG